jgi:hypothetical protein
MFEKGKSGNPAGRPPSICNITAATLRKNLTDELPDILTKLVELAKGGDIQAIKLILDRVCPPIKPQAPPISLPVVESLADQGSEIIRATMQGQIPPDVGSQLITALSNQGKLIELQELTERLQRVEKQLEARQ